MTTNAFSKKLILALAAVAWFCGLCGLSFAADRPVQAADAAAAGSAQNQSRAERRATHAIPQIQNPYS